MAGWLERSWYGSNRPLLPLAPLEWLFCSVAASRRAAYSSGDKSPYRAPVPVVVVGNISIGGTGKTPFTLWLLELLKAQGYRPGVVSRGYGGKAPTYPFEVTPASSVLEAGDEPLMLVQRSGCPLVVDPDRGRAAAHLLDLHQCDLIISDDGLQHYALARDIEIAVVDSQRGLGNGRCLPVGPLRESPERLDEVDFVVINGEAGGFEFAGGHTMLLCPTATTKLNGEVADLPLQSVHAIAGIGNPQRYFDCLTELGYSVLPHPFPDHHAYRSEDLQFDDNYPILMTEKDAVKCRAFGSDNRYYLPINAQLPSSMAKQLIEKIAALAASYERIRNSDG